MNTTWTINDLTITFRHLIGLISTKGERRLVLPYVKAPVLTQDSTDLMLRIMEHVMSEVLPGATPVVLDTRRGKAFKLRANANRADLDGVLVAESAKYVAHWNVAS